MLRCRRAVLLATAAAVLLLFLSGCMSVRYTAREAGTEDVGYHDQRIRRYAVTVPPAGARSAAGGRPPAADSAAGGQAVTEAEITIQCLLPSAVSSPESIHAPLDELHAFAGSVAAMAAPSEPRPDLVAEVEAGRLQVANAAWWDPHPADATDAVQAAIDSGAPAVVIPAGESAWQVRPLELRGNLFLLFEDGAEVVAKSRAYTKRNASVFKSNGDENIIIWGYGATVRMRKHEYSSWPYHETQFRHALRFQSVRNLGVFGIEAREAGGDGIYLGPARGEPRYCENVVIRDSLFDDNNRQGLTIVSARRVEITSSTFSNTKGHLPQAGIDLEPDHPYEILQDIVVRDSLFLWNRGAGIQFFLWNQTRESDPISVRIEGCEFRGNTINFLVALAGGRPHGSIVLEDSPVGLSRWIREPEGLEIIREYQ